MALTKDSPLEIFHISPLVLARARVGPVVKYYYYFFNSFPQEDFTSFCGGFCPKLEPITSLNKIPLALIIAPSSCYLQGSVPASSDILKIHQSAGNEQLIHLKLLLWPWHQLMSLSLLFVCRFRWLLGLCEVQWRKSAICRWTQPCHLISNQSVCQDWLQRSQPVWKQPMLGWSDVYQPVVHIPVCPAWWLCL